MNMLRILLIIIIVPVRKNCYLNYFLTMHFYMVPRTTYVVMPNVQFGDKKWEKGMLKHHKIRPK